MRDGQTLWGWPHCVQDEKLTQLAIDRRLTLIAFEAMNHWHADGTFALHVFHKNNELAGYSSVLHALQLVGLTGDYGRRLRAAVIGFGATARGAVTALKAHGIHDVDVLTNREVAAVGSPIHSARIMHFHHDDENPRRSQVMTETGLAPLSVFLAEHDLIVNCVLQDTDAPLTFLVDEDLPTLAPGTLIVDVSCDLGMGFSWARPTSFEDPMTRPHHRPPLKLELVAIRASRGARIATSSRGSGQTMLEPASTRARSSWARRWRCTTEVPNGEAVELGPLHVEVQVVLPREADAAVDLQARGHDPAGGVGGPHLGGRRGDRRVGVARGERPGGVVDGRAHALDVDEHVGAAVLHRLERADGWPNCTRSLAYSTVRSSTRDAPPSASALRRRAAIDERGRRVGVVDAGGAAGRVGIHPRSARARPWPARRWVAPRW